MSLSRRTRGVHSKSDSAQWVTGEPSRGWNGMKSQVAAVMSVTVAICVSGDVLSLVVGDQDVMCWLMVMSLKWNRSSFDPWIAGTIPSGVTMADGENCTRVVIADKYQSKKIPAKRQVPRARTGSTGWMCIPASGLYDRYTGPSGGSSGGCRG